MLIIKSYFENVKLDWVKAVFLKPQGNTELVFYFLN